AVELAVEGQFPRGGKRDVQLHLALGRGVLVDAEGGNRDVVQRTRLALHHERQLLTGAAPQEGGLEVIVVSLQLELRQLPHVLGPVVSVGHAVQRDGLARLTLGGRRRRGARGGRGGSGLYGDLSRRVARRNRGQHPATGQVHHRDVIGGLVGHVGGATVGAGRAPVRGLAHRDRPGHCGGRGVQDRQLARPLDDGEGPAAVGGEGRVVRRGPYRNLSDNLLASGVEHLD